MEKLGEITLYNADCMEIMKGFADKQFDLAIVDPPYGHNAMDGSRTRKKYGINRCDNWDCYRPDKSYSEAAITRTRRARKRDNSDTRT